jgi:hypothetical protein
MAMEAARSARRRRGGDNAAPADGDSMPAPARARSGEDLRCHTARQPSGWTVRTVTPESIPEGQPFGPEAGMSSPPTSPFESQARDSPNFGVSLHRRLRSGSGNERAQAYDIEYQASRPRTRTMEEHGMRNNSPSALLLQNRQRLGSTASLNSAPYNGVDDAVTSIGHPSVVPGPPFNTTIYRQDSERLRMTKQAALDLDPLAKPSPPTHHSEPGLLATDTDKILQLTKSLRGRMEGPLAFRRATPPPGPQPTAPSTMKPAASSTKPAPQNLPTAR